MSIRFKILSGFSILVGMLFLAGVWSIYELKTVGSSVQQLLDDNYKSIRAARVMGEALEREDSAILILLAGKWDEGRPMLDTADQQFQEGFKTAQSNLTISGEKEVLDEIWGKYKAYKALWERPIVGTKREKNPDWYFSHIHPVFLALRLSIEKLTDMNDQAMYQTASGLKTRAHRAVMPGIVAILASLIFTLIFNYFINYYIANPIIRLNKGIQNFLTHQRPMELKIETKDEIFQLSESIRELMYQCKSYGEKV